MSYGINIKNSYSESITDNNPSLYTKKDGSTISVKNFLNTSGNTFVLKELFTKNPFYCTETRPAGAAGSAVPLFWHTIADSYQTYLTYRCPLPLYNKQDTVFYRPGTQGISLGWQTNISQTEFANQGVMYTTLTTSSTPLPYKIISKDVDLPISAGNMGMKIFNDSGVEILDTRKDIFRLVDYFYINKTEMGKVVPGDSYKIRLPLKRPITNAYVHLAYNNSLYRYYVSATNLTYLYVPLITQPSPDYLEISTCFHQFSGSNSYTGFMGATQDMLIMVGE